jgi:hypothetical protein
MERLVRKRVSFGELFHFLRNPPTHRLATQAESESSRLRSFYPVVEKGFATRGRWVGHFLF